MTRALPAEAAAMRAATAALLSALGSPLATRRTRSHAGYRAVNNLAIQALVAAYTANKVIVDESSARAAVTEISRVTTPTQ
jgi:type II secretory pathway predicted ATPase ExeA